MKLARSPLNVSNLKAPTPTDLSIFTRFGPHHRHMSSSYYEPEQEDSSSNEEIIGIVDDEAVKMKSPQNQTTTHFKRRKLSKKLPQISQKSGKFAFTLPRKTLHDYYGAREKVKIKRSSKRKPISKTPEFHSIGSRYGLSPTVISKKSKLFGAASFSIETPFIPAKFQSSWELKEPRKKLKIERKRKPSPLPSDINNYIAKLK